MAGKEFEDYARESVRLASQTDNAELRNQLLEMPREWMGAAMGEEEEVDDARNPPLIR
jgi:hypothetical protein